MIYRLEDQNTCTLYYNLLFIKYLKAYKCEFLPFALSISEKSLNLIDLKGFVNKAVKNCNNRPYDCGWKNRSTKG